MIEQISAAELLQVSRRTLGLVTAGGIDDAFVAAALRRAAANVCPCSRTTVAVAVRDSLQFLAEDSKAVATTVDDMLEGLLVAGDLLELNQVSVDDPDVKSTWVFAAPPAFVARRSGTVFLMGIAPGDAPALPASLSARIVHQGYTRLITPEASEDLPTNLRNLGLLQQSERAWLRSPKEQSAEDLCESLIALLMSQAPSGKIEDLEILDATQSVDFYPGRWVRPQRQTGAFVARRPQAYGPALWCYAKLQDGEARKILDFPLPEPQAARWRGCDAAWHLQMAIDYCQGTPQKYRKSRTSEGARLDFFSPLPLWAQRRLAIVGQAVPRQASLCSYELPEQELAAEENFLRKRMWLTRSETD